MNILKSFIAKLKSLRAKRIAQKYAEYYSECISAVLTATIQTLQKADQTKTEVVIGDAKFIIRFIQNFGKNHGPFIKSTGMTFIEECKTEKATAKMKEVVKILQSTFKTKVL